MNSCVIFSTAKDILWLSYLWILAGSSDVSKSQVIQIWHVPIEQCIRLIFAPARIAQQSSQKNFPFANRDLPMAWRIRKLSFCERLGSHRDPLCHSSWPHLRVAIKVEAAHVKQPEWRDGREDRLLNS
jgi:hypothetical protein